MGTFLSPWAARVWVAAGGILVLTLGVSRMATGAPCPDLVFADGFDSGAHPVATILQPGDGETHSTAAPVPFLGAANDGEDGTVSGSALVWCSSLDGVFGTGGSFSATLSAGDHIITLTATDSDGTIGADQIALTMAP
jgi:hypothetical protein